MIEFTKELEGKILYAKGAGNNARRGSRIEEYEVVKVARVNVTIKQVGYSRERVLRKSDSQKNYLDGGYSSGYYFYETLGEIEEEQEAEELYDNIKKKYFSSYTMRSPVPLGTLKLIQELLEGE